ncbi:MAG: hypothetical protein KBS74_06410 [Clostridiales bacterium]|nr:hypothetical protein [Candidatus Cacconaster stercorequi]
MLRPEELQLNEHLSRLKEDYRALCGGRIAYDVPALADEKTRSSGLYTVDGLLRVFGKIWNDFVTETLREVGAGN